MGKREIIIIDADTGIDDSLAIAVASYFKHVEIKLIVATRGNIDAAQSAKNTKNILQAIGRDDIPVAIGADKPIGKKTVDISVHGEGGLGGYPFPEDDFEYVEGDVSDAIYQAVMSSQQKIKYLCLGPATTLANYLIKFPETVGRFARVYFSAGLIEETPKGQLPYMGFNVAFDPKAAEVVIDSGVPITVCPSDMGHISYLNWKDVVRLKNTNKTGEMFEYIFRSYRDRHVTNGIATHDLCAFLSMVDKQMFGFKNANLSVKYYDGLPSGVLDIEFDKNGKFIAADSIDIKRFKRSLFKTIKKMP